jgi:aspartate dehydrogenase
MSPAAPLRIGLIGDGGISRSVRTTLATLSRLDFEIVGLLSRRAVAAGASPHFAASIDELLNSRPDVVVECASHEAVHAYGEAVLRSGVALIVVSIGALADAGLQRRLEDTAGSARAKLILAPGAIGGIDALAAARFGGLERVCYRGRKPPLAWRGTPAEQLLELGAVTEPTVIYRGNAREAARRYPKNSNVAATVALAGLGFEGTEVELLADPTVERNVHELSFEGNDGHFEMTMVGVPSPENPKTSMLTAHSVVRILAALRLPVVI